jgi:cytochrome c oxidase subunit 4
MHSDQESIRKSIKTYVMVGAALFVFTGITVAVNQVHLAIPLAITVALIIATMKGSMVASIFMHLSHEKKWIYGSLLLTVMFFVVLIFVPFLTVHDEIGKPNPSQTMVPVEHVMEH